MTVPLGQISLDKQKRFPLILCIELLAFSLEKQIERKGEKGRERERKGERVPLKAFPRIATFATKHSS